MNVDKFLQVSSNKTGPYLGNRLHLKQKGFSELYVRYVPKRFIHRNWYGPVLDIASVETRRKGKGTFKALIKHLRETYPHLHLYVESVLAEQLRGGLVRMGFVNATPEILMAPSFFLPAREPWPLPTSTSSPAPIPTSVPTEPPPSKARSRKSREKATPTL